MSGITPTPRTPTTPTVTPTTTPTTTPSTTPATTTPTTPRTTPSSGGPSTVRSDISGSVVASRLARTTAPKASDIVPAEILRKHGLETDKLNTTSTYKGEKWSVGYMPYFGDSQYVAFGKYADTFKNPAGASDLHGYFEFYANPPSNLEPGSWIADGTISESDFERATGVDVTGSRKIGNDAYKLLRESGAPKDAKYALFDGAGKQYPVRAGDRFVPTIVTRVPLGPATTGTQTVEVEARGEAGYFKKGTNEPVTGDVVWRLKGTDGKIRGGLGDKAQSRDDLVGVTDNVKFDFLDAAGEMVSYNPPSDRIVPTVNTRDGVKAYIPQRSSSGEITGYKEQILDKKGERVVSETRGTLTEAEFKQRTRGKDVIHRVQERSGALKGDGKVQNSYDMSWWGKCHNVAAIGASSMKLPAKDVKLVTNVNERNGDVLGLQFRDGAATKVLVPQKTRTGNVTGYEEQTRDAAGTVSGRRNLSVADGNKLAADKKAEPVVIARDGKVKAAEVSTMSTEEVTTMVAHMGDGAVEYKGSLGNRYWGFNDQIKLKDGRNVGAWITEVETASGNKLEVGSRSGTDYDETDRSMLRGPGLSSKTVYSGGRSVGWSSIDMAALNQGKAAGDKIKTVTVSYPDGRTEKIAADKIANLGWENKLDIQPDQLWAMHKKVGEKGSSVIEKDPGTHVWNYTIDSMDTKPMKAADVPSWLKENDKKPGILSGSTGDAGKYYFSTKINGSDFTYWVKFNNDGTVKDYNYLNDSAPDFFWTQHVKDPIDSTWDGEAQAPGANMRDIQRLYNASTGAYDPYAVGGFLTMGDLQSRKAVRPPANP